MLRKLSTDGKKDDDDDEDDSGGSGSDTVDNETADHPYMKFWEQFGKSIKVSAMRCSVVWCSII